jgi:hypothetical protein
MSKLTDWIEAHRDNPDDELAVRNYTLNAEMYEREFAEAEAKGIVVECSVCGYPENPESSLNGDEYIKHKVCFMCWFWLHHVGLKNGPTARSIIVKGVHYVDAGNKPNERHRSFLGFGGSKWWYRKIGETDYVETNNMWHQGTIPKRFNIPDTHEFKPYERKEVKHGGTNRPFEG